MTEHLPTCQKCACCLNKDFSQDKAERKMSMWSIRTTFKISHTGMSGRLDSSPNRAWLRSACVYPSTFFVIVLIGLFIIPLSSAQSNPTTTEGTTIATMSHDLDLDVEEPIAIDLKPLAENIVGEPRLGAVRRVRKDKSRKLKCPKKFRRSLCMNNGRCRWIPEIKEATCRCKKSWQGERCEEPRIEFTENGSGVDQNALVIAIVLSVFGLLAVLTATCICWRRFKNVRNQLRDEEIAKEKEAMLEHRKTSKSDSIRTEENRN